jgi:ubiquinone/menaquinone biosynthesis C-methylase UbiE
MEETRQLTDRPKGVMSGDYHHDRLKSPGPRYRLRRRGLEAARILREFGVPHPKILDIGTADGLMLDYVCKIISPSGAIGIDRSWELLKTHTNNYPVSMADAEKLPFLDSAFDAVIATAIIEHVPHPAEFLNEIRRVLKSSGVAVITTPVPLFEEFASHLGFLKEDDHQETFNIKKLASLASSQKFEILEAQKFMMSPVGFPGEIKIESVMRKIGLSPLLLNQLLAVRKM